MKVSWKWLNELVSLSCDVETLATRLTDTGSEVEAIERPCERIRGVFVGRVLSLTRHPEKPSLWVACVEDGRQKRQVVTAAPNLSLGDCVPYAPPGAVIADGTVLAKRSFGTIESEGMVLSAEEIGLPQVEDEFGILKLPPDAPVGSDLVRYLQLDDAVLDISVTPNRGDLLSILGFAREARALFPESAWHGIPVFPLEEGMDWPLSFHGVRVDDEGCFSYALGFADKIRVRPSPLGIRIRLALCGIRPVSNIVDATNWSMWLLGQPLHAFDADCLPGEEICVRGARHGEKLVTLDGKERICEPDDLLITSGGIPVGLAGVMGGLNSEIKPTTKRVLIESAIFSPERISRTSRRLGLSSEASSRYAHSVDPCQQEPALGLTLELLKQWDAGECSRKILLQRAKTFEFPQVCLTRRTLKRVLQWDDLEAASKILGDLGFALSKEEEGKRYFQVPSWRSDVTIEDDLIEEVGRLRGYDAVPSRIPGGLKDRGQASFSVEAQRVLREIARGRGYVEVVTYSFISMDDLSSLGLPEEDPRSCGVPLLNPISQEQSLMRPLILPSLLRAVSANLRFGYRRAIRLFEMGRVFFADKSGDPRSETDHLAGILSAGRERHFPFKEREKEDFFTVKADVLALCESRGISISVTPGNEPFGHAGQTADLCLNGEKIGFLARLKSSVIRGFDIDIEEPVYAFEMELDPLVFAPLRRYGQPKRFPASYRDIALIVSNEKTAELVQNEIRELGGDLLEEVRLFDVFEGKGIPEGARSLAFSLTYRHPDRTLSDTEVEAVHERVRISLKERGYILR